MDSKPAQETLLKGAARRSHPYGEDWQQGGDGRLALSRQRGFYARYAKGAGMLRKCPHPACLPRRGNYSAPLMASTVFFWLSESSL